MGWPNNYVQGVYNSDNELVGIDDGAGGSIKIDFEKNGVYNDEGVLKYRGRVFQECGVIAPWLLNKHWDGSDINGWESAFDELSEAGITFVRVHIIPFAASGSANSILTCMYGGTSKQIRKWTDFNSAYTSAVQNMMDYAETKGIVVFPLFHWSTANFYTAHGDALAQWVLSSSTSRLATRQYFKAFAEQFKYHKALGGYMLYGEAGDKTTYTAPMTESIQNDILSEGANVIRSVDPIRVIISANDGFVNTLASARSNINGAIQSVVACNPHPIDTLSFSYYAYKNYISANAIAYNNATGDNFTPTTGWEFHKEVLTSLVAEGNSIKKPFIASEFGVRLQEELSPTSSTRLESILSDVKKSGCQLIFFWQYGVDSTDSTGQSNWNIRPTSDNGRGKTYLNAIGRYNSYSANAALQKINYFYDIYGRAPFRSPLPSTCLTSGAGIRLNIPANAAFNSANGSVLLWLRKNKEVSSFANILNFALNSPNIRGWAVLFDNQAAPLPMIELRRDNAGAGASLRNSASILDTSVSGSMKEAVAIGNWCHIAFGWSSDSNGELCTYFNGYVVNQQDFLGVQTNAAYRKTASPTLYVPPSAADVGRIADGSNISMADVLIYNRKLTDAEILNYYCYGSIPSSGLVAHYPLDVDGRNISSEVVSPASTLDTSATGVPVYGESLLLPSIKSNTIIKNVSSSDSVSLTTATSANITYIDLPIGTWEVSGSVYFTPAATTTMTDLIAGTSLSSATLEPLNSTDDKISRAAGAGQTIVKSSPIRSVKVNVKSAARIFLVANATFAISTMTAYGELRASLQ